MKRSLALAAAIASAMMSPAAYGLQPAAKGDAASALKELAAVSKDILARENVQAMLDRPLLLKDYGVTYQPELTAPKNLASKLAGCDLRRYQGVMFYDMAYALAFDKRREVADDLQTMDAVMQAFDVRSFADFGGRLAATIRRASKDDEKADPRELLDQLSADLAEEVPNAMASAETAHFMLDTVYGFAIEAICVAGHFELTDRGGKLRDWRMTHPDGMAWLTTVVRVFEAFAKAEKDLRLRCRAGEALGLVRELEALYRAEYSGKLTREQARGRLKTLVGRAAKRRAAILAGA